MTEDELMNEIYDFDSMVKINKGGFGTIFKATKIKTKNTVALTKIVLDRHNPNFPKNEESELNEFLLKKDLFRHQNLIDYEECFILRDPVKYLNTIYLEMPLSDKDVSK